MRIAYHRCYAMGFPGLGALHPFDLRRAGRAWRLLGGALGAEALAAAALEPDREASREELAAVHAAAYLDTLSDPATAADIVEVPPLRHAPAALLDRFLLRPMRWAARGTVLAAEAAAREGAAANLAGGFHHAKPGRGEGFCVYNDAALAVARLRAAGALRERDRVLVVDTDAHLGNGNAHAFMADRRVGLLDVHNAWVYPRGDAEARARIDFPAPLEGYTVDGPYLEVLEAALVRALAAGPWAFAVYNAGTDILDGDPVGGLAVSADGVFERDRMVVSALRDRGVPLVLLPSGGYTDASHRCLARTVAWMAAGADVLGACP